MSECGVCGQNPSKYKCPACGLPYCSIDCFRPHKEQHVTTDSVNKSLQYPLPSKPVEPVEPPASATTPAPVIMPLQDLLESAELQSLFKRHPALKPQLDTIYSATIEPSLDQPHPFKPIRGAEGRFRGRHRSRPKGPWTQQQGDESALRLIAQARVDRKGLCQDGVREFIRLVTLKSATQDNMQLGASATA